ncbi:MAG: lipoprotein-releasing system transmembrane subunit LolC, partial [Candidatus Binatia bacterium]
MTTLDITLSVMTGFENDLRDRILGFSPHVIVTSYGGPIREAPKLLEEISETPGVAAAAPYVYVQAMVSRGGAVTGVFIRGVEPERANAVVDIAKYLKEGSVADLGRRHTTRVAAEGRERPVELGGVVIGEELGRQLGVSKGDVVTMVVPSAVGMVPRVKSFVVAGVFNSGMFEYDAGFVYMSLADAQAIL